MGKLASSLGALVLALGALALPAPIAPTVRADDTLAVHVGSLTITGEVHGDTRITVTELVTEVVTSGTLTTGVRRFPGQFASVTSFAANDAEGPLQVGGPTADGAFTYRLRTPATPATGQISFTLTYELADQVVTGRDVADLQWLAVPTGHDPIDHVVIAARLPGVAPPALDTSRDDDTNLMRAWAHGPASPTVQITALGVRILADDLGPSVPLRIRIVLPASLYTLIGSDEILARIIAEERAASSPTSGPTSGAVAGTGSAPRAGSTSNVRRAMFLALAVLAIGLMVLVVAVNVRARRRRPPVQ